ncbi:MAG: DUF1492 domain-containing protein [Oscillospiraceae bacterium]|jgi:DNA-directed RNA polymerase specialized sigma24 family protein|nr:DUF1492 domain-containing protein [Oscillospiraceae bacterium]
MATPENQKKISWLSRFRKSEQELSRLYDEQERWRAKAEKVTQRISPMPPGAPSGNRVQDAVEKIGEVESHINHEIVEQCKERDEVTVAINTVSNATLRMVLKMRYIDGLTFEQIAVNMNYTFRHIIRLHGQALHVLFCPTQNAV